MKRLFDYALAAVGPVASAGVQFILSLLILQRVSAADFGTFSFLLVLSQLLQGVWSALFCAPLLVMLNQSGAKTGDGSIGAIFLVSLILSGVAGAAIAGLAFLLELPVPNACVFGAYVALTLCRWLGRSWCYAVGAARRTNAADLLYALALLLMMGLLWYEGRLTLLTAMTLLLLATLIGMIPLGTNYLKMQFGHAIRARLADYRHAWRGQGSWALIGVLTTEATANSHAYIVTGLMGPAAFAPLAATALVIRPANVVMNALMEFERAQMARLDLGSNGRAILRAIGFFRVMLLLLWLGTAGLAALVVTFGVGSLIPAHYPPQVLAVGAVLWLFALGCRFGRVPESAFLQAIGDFRPLALASVYSCLFSVVAVLVLVVATGPLWSIIGVAIGEAAFAVWTWRAARRRLRPSRGTVQAA